MYFCLRRLQFICTMGRVHVMLLVSVGQCCFNRAIFPLSWVISWVITFWAPFLLIHDQFPVVSNVKSCIHFLLSVYSTHELGLDVFGFAYRRSKVSWKMLFLEKTFFLAEWLVLRIPNYDTLFEDYFAILSILKQKVFVSRTEGNK